MPLPRSLVLGSILGGFFRRGEIPVGLIGVEELQSILLMPLQPFALEYGAFVPAHPQPSHSVQDRLSVLVAGSLPVRVLNAKNQNATLLLCKKPVEEGCSGTSHMEIPGGRGCEAYT